MTMHLTDLPKELIKMLISCVIDNTNIREEGLYNVMLSSRVLSQPLYEHSRREIDYYEKSRPMYDIKRTHASIVLPNLYQLVSDRRKIVIYAIVNDSRDFNPFINTILSAHRRYKKVLSMRKLVELIKYLIEYIGTKEEMYPQTKYNTGDMEHMEEYMDDDQESGMQEWLKFAVSKDYRSLTDYLLNRIYRDNKFPFVNPENMAQEYLSCIVGSNGEMNYYGGRKMAQKLLNWVKTYYPTKYGDMKKYIKQYRNMYMGH